MTRCAVLGDPVEHSLSPALHRAAYSALGLEDWAYDAVRVPAGTLAGFLDGLSPDWRGLSLTMPLKRELLALASARGWSVSGRARAAGGANTLVRDGDAWTGDNTDLPGAVAAVRERYAGPVDRVVVVGGGATAASVGLALCDLGATSLTLLVRSVERAQETVDTVAAHASAPSVRAVVEAPGQADVLVSTVPADAQDPGLLERCGARLLFEALYDPWPTPLATAALGAGVPLVSGLDLLVHQAALQVERFTGRAVGVEVLRAAGAALAARGGARSRRWSARWRPACCAWPCRGWCGRCRSRRPRPRCRRASRRSRRTPTSAAAGACCPVQCWPASWAGDWRAARSAPAGRWSWSCSRRRCVWH